MIDKIADIFLLITHEYASIVIFMVGYTFVDRLIFKTALSLLLFTMVYNYYLKSVWQIPLPPSLGKEGWAFPSGHMHTTFVFLAYPAWNLKCRAVFRVFVGLLLTIIGCALVIKGYHYPVDILGAVFFGGANLVLFSCLNKWFLTSKNEWCLDLFFFVGAISIHFYLIEAVPRSEYLWIADGALLGLLVASMSLSLLGLEARISDNRSSKSALFTLLAMFIIVPSVLYLSNQTLFFMNTSKRFAVTYAFVLFLMAFLPVYLERLRFSRSGISLEKFKIDDL